MLVLIICKDTLSYAVHWLTNALHFVSFYCPGELMLAKSEYVIRVPHKDSYVTEYIYVSCT